MRAVNLGNDASTWRVAWDESQSLSGDEPDTVSSPAWDESGLHASPVIRNKLKQTKQCGTELLQRPIEETNWPKPDQRPIGETNWQRTDRNQVRQ